MRQGTAQVLRRLRASVGPRRSAVVCHAYICIDRHDEPHAVSVVMRTSRKHWASSRTRGALSACVLRYLISTLIVMMIYLRQ